MPKKSKLTTKAKLLLAMIGTCAANQQSFAADTACEVTLSNGGLIDGRSIPTSPTETVLNGRTDGNTALCSLLNLQGTKFSYPNGLTINTAGTQIKVFKTRVDIKNQLIIDGNNIDNGLVIFQANDATSIQGPVSIRNKGKLKLITHNNRSSTTRLLTKEAYFNIDADSELLAEYKLGNTSGDTFFAGAISGSGNLRLSNTGTTTRAGTIYLSNDDGQDYTFDGEIFYEQQQAPELRKYGMGNFTFNGNITNTTTNNPGFNNGFNLIQVNEGSVTTTTNAFILGTNVRLSSGASLIFDQSFSGEATGASFEGEGTVYKRGSGTVTLGGISNGYRGGVVIEEGTLSLSRNASLGDARLIDIQSGTTLDISGLSGSNTDLGRLKGNGTIALGTKDVRQVVKISPGNSIGRLRTTGTGDFRLNGTLIEIELDPTNATGDVAGTTHDQLSIQGSVSTLASPIIELFDVQNGSSPSAFLNGREFTVLTAGSGLSSIPVTSIIEDQSSFHAFVGADPDTVTITDTEVKVQFGIKTVQQVINTVAQTPVTKPNGGASKGSSKNKATAAKQIIQQSTGLTGSQAPTQAQLTSLPTLQSLTGAKLANTANNNNPEAYSSNLSVNLEYANFIGNLVMDRAAGRSIAVRQFDQSFAKRGDLWANVEYANGSVDGKEGHTGGFDYALSTFLIGKDIVHSATRKSGVFLGVGASELDEHDHINQEIEGDVFQIGAYRAHELIDGSIFSALFSGFYGDFESERQNRSINTAAAPLSTSDFDAFGFTLGASFGKDLDAFKNTAWRLTPSAGLAFTYVRQSKIDEQNGGASYDYEVDATSADALLMSIGIDSTYDLSNGEQALLADFGARYEYDALAEHDSTHDIQARIGDQTKDSFVGQNRGTHGLVLGVGLLSELSSKLTLGAGYEYATRSGGSDSSIGVDLSYRL